MISKQEWNRETLQRFTICRGKHSILPSWVIARTSQVAVKLKYSCFMKKTVKKLNISLYDAEMVHLWNQPEFFQRQLAPPLGPYNRQIIEPSRDRSPISDIIRWARVPPRRCHSLLISRHVLMAGTHSEPGTNKYAPQSIMRIHGSFSSEVWQIVSFGFRGFWCSSLNQLKDPRREGFFCFRYVLDRWYLAFLIRAKTTVCSASNETNLWGLRRSKAREGTRSHVIATGDQVAGKGCWLCDRRLWSAGSVMWPVEGLLGTMVKGQS